MPKVYSRHEIRKFFHDNVDKTLIICDFCAQSYKSNTSVTNLKRHFLKYHKSEYQSILQRYLEKKQNALHKKGLIDLRNIQESVNLRNVQVSEENIDEYITEEETEEVVSSGEVISNVVEEKEDFI
ncbi:5213_t:CDS:1, partial [Dentiscutata heterogama]